MNHEADQSDQVMQSITRSLAMAVAFFCPIVAIYIGGDVLGASDPLMPLILAALVFGRWRGRWDACHTLLAVFLLVAFSSLLQIDERRDQIRSGMKWVRLLGICLPFYLGLRLPVTPQLIRRAVWYLFWGGMIALLIGLVIYQLQIPIRTEGQRLWFRGGSVYRAGGLIGETTAFGHLTATWMTLCFGLLVCYQPIRRWKLLCAVLIVLGITVVVAASSRAAMLNLLVGCGGLVLMRRYRVSEWHNMIAGALAAVVVVVALLMLVIGFNRSGAMRMGERVVTQFERFVPVGSANEASSGRIVAWQKYSRIIRHHLWFGIGYKTAGKLFPGRSPDNSIVSALLETGLIGLTTLIAFVGLTCFALYKRALVGEPHAGILIAVWLGQVVQALTNDTHTLLLGVPVLYLITGLVLQLPVQGTTLHGSHDGATT